VATAEPARHRKQACPFSLEEEPSPCTAQIWQTGATEKLKGARAASKATGLLLPHETDYSIGCSDTEGRRGASAEGTYVPEDGGDEDLEEHFLGDGRPASPARISVGWR